MRYVGCQVGQVEIFCNLSGMLGSVGWYGWGAKIYLGHFRFWISSNDWRVSWFFRSLYIADILWKIIQDSLGSLCDARVLLKQDTFTNPERGPFFALMLILLFIHKIYYFPQIPDRSLFFYLLITTPGPDGLYNVLQMLCNTMALKGYYMATLNIGWCKYLWLLALIQVSSLTWFLYL